MTKTKTKEVQQEERREELAMFLAKALERILAASDQEHDETPGVTKETDHPRGH